MVEGSKRSQIISKPGCNLACFIMKYIAAFFLVFIIGVVILADANHIPAFIRALYDFPNGDKLGHFILFGLLDFFLTRAFLSSLPSRPRGWVTLSTGLTLAFFITLEELSQKFIAARTFSFLDLFASFLGVVVGGWVAWRLKSDSHL
ncbi:MAG: VanZ family protein [Chloroflexi bacterium]|nr:VanZ family protein [Chloroflexota bacterium]